MYPMQEFSAYVFDPSLGHDVINVIRKFLINPFNEIKINGTRSRARYIMRLLKHDFTTQDGIQWAHYTNRFYWWGSLGYLIQETVTDQEYMIKQLDKCSTCSRQRHQHRYVRRKHRDKNSSARFNAKMFLAGKYGDCQCLCGHFSRQLRLYPCLPPDVPRMHPGLPESPPVSDDEDNDEINNHNQEVWEAWEQQDEVLYTHPSYE
uniref:Uncharacterized protein n=1 Tax=viral metagenome TaxID=1070528 RepID=A0A6C0AG09_9ZZZZ|tara:strand:- start:14648 stop:15262 length:615 start_codon:yes stop_codon:yes gene_type:complete